MAPPISTIPVSELEASINTLPSGKPRNPKVKLGDCVLKELVQYKCLVEQPKEKAVASGVLCEPLVHLLRRCPGGLNIETTAWEGWKAKQEGEGVEG
ncbi:hypothetical protein CC77DRAFT_1017803 [Alternaria alternata]|uniref:Uncharacterized protein n=1 Tax=Alternaria alternata TaxID=5599 RepID=A0A177DTY4_ALTAL|nr:hypothetical protein CC77DRAFT_1017803 [Alternaria alternata]OAG22956.1 hypothetical protein CC77DRAFT_1017803 [Alternaria alternata]